MEIEEDIPTVMCKLRYQKDAMEIAIDSEFPFQELERQAREEFGIFSDVIIKYEDLVGEKVRLSARNINKVVLTFLKTEAKVIQMWMESEDDLEEQAEGDEARVADFDKQLDQGVFDRKKVYVFGAGNRAQLCRGNLDSVTIPEEAELLTQHFPKTLACGAYHTICITEEQGVLAWGSGEEGQLGVFGLELPNSLSVIHSKVVHQLTPAPIPMLAKQFVRLVAAGYSHSAALTTDGRLYTWGGDKYGLEVGFPMLGYGIEVDWTQREKTVKNSDTPQIVKALENSFLMTVDCGGYHTACIDDKGEVYTWGVGNRGQLGHGDVLDWNAPNKVQALCGRNMVDIKCGHLHTLALQSNRELLSWGGNGSGQLGQGIKEDLFSPRTVKGLLGTDVTIIACGAFHTGAVDTKCSVFTWGQGEYGRLGHGEPVDCTAPRLVEDLERKGIRSLALGLYHTLALADNGDIYSWGSGESGQLGHEDKTRMELKPRMIDSQEGMGIRQVYCGYHSSMSLNSDVFDRPIPPVEQAEIDKLNEECRIM